MAPTTTEPGALPELGRTLAHWLLGWWRIVHLGALLLVLAASPASYDRPHRAALARHMVQGTAPALPWFAVLSALLSLVVIRIVLVTAVSYGLSQYALEMVVRVLVLELIPLAAALFGALRCTLPQAADLVALRVERAEADRVQLLRGEVLPRVQAGVFAVLMLAAVSCVLTLVLAYLSVYGFTAAGWAGYTHTVGHVFSPAVSLIFVLKVVSFSVAVALIPIATVLHETRADRPRAAARISAEMQGLVRMFLVIFLIEAASLVGNYY